MKRLFLLCMGVLIVFAVPAKADPGPSDEVVVIAGSCDDGTTIVSAHNTQDKSLGYLIRIDGRLVEQGRLDPGERVQRTYEVPLGESHFYRIRLGLPVDHVYFSDEAATDRTNCSSPTSSSTTPPPTSTTPPPTSSSSSGGSSSSSSSSVGGGGGSSTRGPTVKGESGTDPGDVAFTGSSNVPWLAAAMFVLLLVGSLALRIGSRKGTVEDPEN
ncbi:MAG TPA: hypothetical protein VHN56_05615 [Actinomycetota bacterium]|nr:hypothetical protein [Actinomycetota bacterium]